MPPRLYRVILPVSNIDEAAAFYCYLLGIPGERVSPGRHYFKELQQNKRCKLGLTPAVLILH